MVRNLPLPVRVRLFLAMVLAMLTPVLVLYSNLTYQPPTTATPRTHTQEWTWVDEQGNPVTPNYTPEEGRP